MKAVSPALLESESSCELQASSVPTGMQLAQLRELVSLEAPAPKECRICLQSHEQQHNRLVSPCRCLGSLKFVHRQCYLRWIQRVFQQRPTLLGHGFSCQICKSRLRVATVKQKECCSGAEIRVKINDNRLSFAISVLFEVLVILCLSLLSNNLVRDPIDMEAQPTKGVVVIIALLILAALGVVVLLKIVQAFCLTQIRVVTGFSLQPQRNSVNACKVPRIPNIQSHLML